MARMTIVIEDQPDRLPLLTVQSYTPEPNVTAAQTIAAIAVNAVAHLVHQKESDDECTGNSNAR